MSNYSQPVDLYCERLNASFWAEPVNALTNISFIIAGILILLFLRRHKLKSREINILAVMSIIVGLGSFTFHTIATKGAAFADTIPIALFITFALFVIFVRAFMVKPPLAVLYVILFAIANAIILKIFGIKWLNGSIMYVPTFIILIIIGLISARKKPLFSRYILISAAIFFISIIFRSIDNKVCNYFPLGTHFMWHILNGVTMYYAMYALIKLNKNNLNE